MEQNPGGLLRQYNSLYKGYNELYHEISLAAGLADSVFWILYYLLEEGDGCLQRDLCVFAGISKQTIHSAIRKMQDQGLLSLTPGRGRNLHIHLTGEGRRLAEERVLPVIRMERQALADLTPEESRALLALTRKHLDSLRRQTKQYPDRVKEKDR